MDENKKLELQKEIKEKTDLLNKLNKDLNLIKNENQEMEEKIEEKIKNIQYCQKILGEKGNTKFEGNNYSNKVKESEMVTLENQIQKEFNSIQKKCNENLQSKFKVQNIERLIEQQKNLTISYVIIKKLDIKEEFLSQFKIKEVQNNYENLYKLSKNEKLNFQSLKLCGPNLIFRLTTESKFKELKEKCCEIWNLSQTTYYLYDDTFNSMEVCLDENIQKYFLYSQPNDSTLPEGYAIFYLMEKLKDQRDLLTTQKNSINKNESGDNSNKGNLGFGVDLQNCITKLREGKILRGLCNYHYHNKNVNEDFDNFVKEPENNFLCFFIVLLLFSFSLVCAQAKKEKVKNWNKMNILSHSYLNDKFNYSDYYRSMNSMYDYLKLLNDFQYKIYQENINKSENINIYFKYFGVVQYRFFKTLEKECIKDSEMKNSDLYKLYFDVTNLTCYYPGFKGKQKNKTDISDSIVYENNLKIKHNYKTYFGFFDKTGFVLKYNPYDNENYTKANDSIYKIINSNPSNEDKTEPPLLEDNIQGIELTFNLYEPNLDIFTAASIFIQKGVTGNPILSSFEVIPFLSNVYENKKNIKALDIIRIILHIILLLIIVAKIHQKFKDKKNKNILSQIIIVVNVIFQIKNLCLIFSFCFLTKAYSIFAQYNLNSKKYNDNPYFIDFLDYAKKQNEGRYYDQLALFMIGMYLLKYSQLFPIIFTILVCFKKTIIEFLLLVFSIFCLILGMTTTTYFVYGSYIKEYSTFVKAFVTNLKIICFIEDTNTLIQLNEYFHSFTIILIVFYILILRFFFFTLFYPIFTEYLRCEIDQLKYITKKEEQYSIKEKFNKFFCNFMGKRTKMLEDYINNYNKNGDEIETDDFLNSINNS